MPREEITGSQGQIKMQNVTAKCQVGKCGRASHSHAANGLRGFLHLMKHEQQFADDDRQPDITLIGYGEV